MLMLGGFEETVLALAFAPDGRTLASAGKGHAVRVWDALSGEPAGEPWSAPGAYDHNSHLLAYAPTGRSLAVGGRGGSVTLWDPVARRSREVYADSTDRAVAGLAFAPDGSSLLVAHQRFPSPAYPERMARVVLLDPGGEAWGFLNLAGVIACAGFAPDGRTIAVGMADGTVLLFDRDEATDEAEPDDRPGGLEIAVVSFEGSEADPPGRAEGDLTACVVPPAARRPRTAFAPGLVTSVGFAPDGRRMFGHCDGAVACWDPADGRVLGAFEAAPGRVRAMAVAPAGEILAVSTRDGAVRLLDYAGDPVAEYHAGVPELGPLAFAPDGMRLAAGGRGEVVIWDLDH